MKRRPPVIPDLEPPRRKRSLSAEEHALWDSVARQVKPLRASRRLRAAADCRTRRRPAPVAAAPRAASPVKIAPPPKPQAPPLAPIGRRERAKLSRGRQEIDARIDLHGMTQIRAHRALFGFLQRAHHDGLTFVLVITGKGKIGDAERGVLRRQVPQWLALPEFRTLVVGFEEAHVGHGGEGALYVRVRRALGMIPKSGNRFSDKIMPLKRPDDADARDQRDDRAEDRRLACRPTGSAAVSRDSRQHLHRMQHQEHADRPVRHPARIVEHDREHDEIADGDDRERGNDDPAMRFVWQARGRGRQNSATAACAARSAAQIRVRRGCCAAATPRYRRSPSTAAGTRCRQSSGDRCARDRPSGFAGESTKVCGGTSIVPQNCATMKSAPTIASEVTPTRMLAGVTRCVR